jgi:ubiquinone/menaquinone biosynthesis C-methylase UbiE
VLEGFFPATAMPDPDWWQALWPRPGEVPEKVGIESGSDVVDLCCGDGLFTVPLARIARQVLAIDLDPEMLDRARTHASAEGVANCVFLVGDAYDLTKLVADPQDLILIANTFHGVPDKLRLARAVMSVLKQGGRFVVINWHQRPREQTIVLGRPRGPRTEMRMKPEDVTQAVAPAGLRPVELIELPPYHYAAILERPMAQS